jgi:hypothetical protein
MRNVSDECCRENQYTHFLVNFGGKLVPCMRQCRKNIVERTGQGDNVAHEKPGYLRLQTHNQNM